MYFINAAVSEDAGIEPRTVANSALDENQREKIPF